MELLQFLNQIPVPVLVLITIILAVVTLVITIAYIKKAGLEGIRKQTYQLILQAEHKFHESKQGKQKLEWVVQQARSLLPKWLQVFVSEKTLIKIIDSWFQAVKDLLDDGKLNSSGEKEE